MLNLEAHNRSIQPLCRSVIVIMDKLVELHEDRFEELVDLTKSPRLLYLQKPVDVPQRPDENPNCQDREQHNRAHDQRVCEQIRIDKNKATADAIFAQEKANKERRLKLEKETAAAQQKIRNYTFQTIQNGIQALSALAEVAIKDERKRVVLQKGLGITESFVNTYIAATQALSEKGVPTFIFFKKGKIVDQTVGTVSYTQLEESAEEIL